MKEWRRSYRKGENMIAEGNKEANNKWDKLSTEVIDTLDKVREERKKTENKIYEAIKEFEWHTGIKIVKLDFETCKDKMDSRIKIVLERI